MKIGRHKKTAIALWLVLIVSASFEVYKNFTTINMHMIITPCRQFIIHKLFSHSQSPAHTPKCYSFFQPTQADFQLSIVRFIDKIAIHRIISSFYTCGVYFFRLAFKKWERNRVVTSRQLHPFSQVHTVGQYHITNLYPRPTTVRIILGHFVFFLIWQIVL